MTASVRTWLAALAYTQWLPLMRELSAKLTEGENGFSLLPSRLAPCHLPRQRKAFISPSFEGGTCPLVRGGFCAVALDITGWRQENRPLVPQLFIRVHANRPLSLADRNPYIWSLRGEMD